MKAKDLEGQIDLFGMEPFKPKEATSEQGEDVVLDTELEDFLCVGKKKSGELHAVMQKSVQDQGGMVATVAYIDYNKVYTQDLKGKAFLIHYKDSRQAVDAYMEQVDKLRKLGGIKETQIHPEFQKVKCQEMEL